MLPEYIQEVYAKAELLYSKIEIESALDKMAVEMKSKLAQKNPIFLCIGLGGIIPLGNLLPRLDFPLEIDYAHLTRYTGKFHGDKNIEWKAEPVSDFKGRIVVVVDDILDEGLTLATVIAYCKKNGAEEVLSAVLLDKKKPRKKGGLKEADFVGLIVGDRFVFGYGLDYRGNLRNAPGIYAAAPEHC